MADSDYLSMVRFKDNVEFMMSRFKIDAGQPVVNITQDQLVGIYQAAATLSVADIIFHYQEEESR